jgi:glycosyltransferase involved in cell wall biosynthesis
VVRERAPRPGRLRQDRHGLDGDLDLRVTFLCPHVRIAGGVRAILTYADRLARRGHAVTVVVPARGRLRARLANARGGAPDWMPGLAARVRWVGRWSGDSLPPADALVATAWQSARVAASAPPRCGAKFYLVQHYESLYHGAPEAVDATYRLPLRKIVISTWLAGIMREKFASDAEVLVTPVDPALFHRVPVEPRGPRPRVLMLHHEYAWKGVAEGVEAVARARARVPTLRLVGFGVKAPRGGVGYDEFHANPPQESLAALYSGADVYLCPSWDEGLGMPAMEAMACGAALVTYDNGGCRDYARDGETALVARRRDVADLADRLARVAGDAGLRTRLAEAGRRLVTTAFDWERAVTRLETLFGEAG